MYRDSRKVNNNLSFMFVSCLKIYRWEKIYSNIGMILSVAIYHFISIMEVLHIIPKFVKKIRRRNFDMKINMGTTDILKSEHVKKSKITEELNLSQDSKTTSEV